MALLEVNDLTKYYKDVLALNKINIDITKGEFVSVIGPSGSGKTTFIRCINRLIDSSDGQILFDDQNMLSLKGHKLRKARAKIGMIFQHYNLVTRLTVIENVLHGRLGYKSTIEGVLGIYSEQEKQMAMEVLALVGLEDYAYRRCDQLSGGQMQRVGIARALVQEPLLLLCDEPISSLDPGSAKIVMDYIRKVQQEYGITTLVNLHQVEVAKTYSDRILGFNKGNLVFDGTPPELDNESIYNIYGTEAYELIN
ncbi:phosphonate ABC transporter ATP-binding protein [Spirochaeta cellobiosiphila]|uniref:phosphonate ABC transporter ATP-binding protein n=1 Tax=Spirochaeta cellobiosiphila TaxID=504483 RepID=UPI00041734F5|nr:phosphonate ABC transporter ATP-binding protein [Spirochaeta cellobiosiphila]